MTLLLAMISFSLAMSITPGPVNMIILSSGINFGIKRTIPMGILLMITAGYLCYAQFV